MDVMTSDDQIHIEAAFPVPPEQVWEAFTTPAAIQSWWGKHVALDARLGGQLRETWRDDSGRMITTTGTVTTFDPPRMLAMTWADEDWDQPTRVQITLAPKPQGRTDLRLTHTGWAAFPEGQRTERVEAHVDGWTYHLRSLMGYLLLQEGLL